MIQTQTQSGFSLVETLVAISILLIVIVGPMTIVSNSTKSTSFSSDQVTAFFLAQEGVELAQKLRDDLVLDDFAGNCDEPWLVFSDDGTGPTASAPCDTSAPYTDCFNNAGCGLELDDVNSSVKSPVIDCSASSDACQLYFNDDFGDNHKSRYTYDNDSGDGYNYQQTPYKRMIYFDKTSEDYEIRVTSVVEWFPGNTRDPQQVEVVSYLFDVYDIP